MNISIDLWPTETSYHIYQSNLKITTRCDRKLDNSTVLICRKFLSKRRLTYLDFFISISIHSSKYRFRDVIKMKRLLNLKQGKCLNYLEKLKSSMRWINRKMWNQRCLMFFIHKNNLFFLYEWFQIMIRVFVTKTSSERLVNVICFFWLLLHQWCIMPIDEM